MLIHFATFQSSCGALLHIPDMAFLVHTSTDPALASLRKL